MVSVLEDDHPVVLGLENNEHAAVTSTMESSSETASLPFPLAVTSRLSMRRGYTHRSAMLIAANSSTGQRCRLDLKFYHWLTESY